MKWLINKLRLLKVSRAIRINKNDMVIIAVAIFFLFLFAFLHLRSVKRNQDNSTYENFLKKEIQDKQEEIDRNKKNIAELEDKMSTLKGETIFIESKVQVNKKKYADEKRYIDLATPSEQSNILSTNLSEFKDLDRKGYFDLP